MTAATSQLLPAAAWGGWGWGWRGGAGCVAKPDWLLAAGGWLF